MEMNKTAESMVNKKQPISKKTVVSPNKMLASYRKRNQTSENYPLGQEEIESLKKEMERMNLREKIRFLYNKKMPDFEIKKILALPDGEFEVLFNVMNMDDKS